MRTDREPVVSGSFYSSEREELRRSIDRMLGEHISKKRGDNVRALIVPHAGYYYSGSIAAKAYAHLSPDIPYERVFIIGSSHTTNFSGASVYNQGNYKTPLGKVHVDLEIASSLTEKNSDIFSCITEVHASEHSIEVQLPFLQVIFGSSLRIVPIIIGSKDPVVCRDIADALKPFFTAENLFVISSDFSHYPDYNFAGEIDRQTMEILCLKDPSRFHDWVSTAPAIYRKRILTAMCGWSAGLVLLCLAENEDELQFKHIAYSNSGDVPGGDKQRVVGYHALALEDSNTGSDNTEHTLTKQVFTPHPKQKKTLLMIARQAIISRLEGKSFKDIPAMKNKLSDIPFEGGAFVTLHTSGGKLRGCIGRLRSSIPALTELISEMAISAAFADTRFDPVRKEELDDLQIEISLLGPMVKVENTRDIIPGRHGVYLVKGQHSATFLPCVAEEQNWDRMQLLGHLSRDKAGLQWDSWKDADLYIYEAVVFSDANLKS